MDKLGNKINQMSYFTKWFILGSIVGVVAGIGAYVFFESIRFFEFLFLDFILKTKIPTPIGEGDYLNFKPSNRFLFLPLITAFAGLIVGWLVYTFAPEAEGHGTDAAIDAFHNKGGKVRGIVILIKTIASAITIGSGGSAGREGPTAQISAGIGSLLADLLRLDVHDRRIMLAAGIGAGIGTIFKTPIAGAILAAEIFYIRDFESEVIFPSLVASAIGYSIFGALVGFVPIFGYYTHSFNPERLPLYITMGVFCGVMAKVYVNTFYGVHDIFKAFKIPKYIKPAIGMFLSGLISLVFPQAIGIGYGWAQSVISLKFNVMPTYGLPLILIMLLIPFVKIITTSLTVGSGGSGGVFAPGIVIGAFIGGFFGLLFHNIFPSLVPLDIIPAFSIVGMVSFFGATGKVPVATTLMVVEMTGSLQLLPAAMLAVAISYIISGNTTIYKSQVYSMADSPTHKSLN